MTAPEVVCQVCGTLFSEGPTGQDRDRYARRTCGACEASALHAQAYWTRARIAAAIARGKAEILFDIASGRVPAAVTTFAALHDYVDANEYGGLCEEPIDPSFAPANEVQDALDAWLAGGRQAATP